LPSLYLPKVSANALHRRGKISAILNFEWVMDRVAGGLTRAHSLEPQPIGRPVAIVAGDALPL